MQHGSTDPEGQSQQARDEAREGATIHHVNVGCSGLRIK
jgi:hypothetical protein